MDPYIDFVRKDKKVRYIFDHEGQQWSAIVVDEEDLHDWSTEILDRGAIFEISPANVKALRLLDGREANEVARQIGVTVKSIWDWESGLCAPTQKNLIKLSHAYRCPWPMLTSAYEMSKSVVVEQVWYARWAQVFHELMRDHANLPLALKIYEALMLDGRKKQNRPKLSNHTLVDDEYERAEHYIKEERRLCGVKNWHRTVDEEVFLEFIKQRRTAPSKIRGDSE